MDVADEVRYERMRKRLRKKEEKVKSTRKYLESLKERGYSHSLPAYEKAIKEAERAAAPARRELNAFEREHDLPISVAEGMGGGRIYENVGSARYENLKHDFYTASDEYEVVRREYNDMLRSGRTDLSVLQRFRVANNKMKLAQSRLLIVEEGIPASEARLKIDEAQRELNRSIEIMRGAPRTGTEIGRPRATPTVIRDFSGNLVRTELSATQLNVLEAARKKLAEGNYTAKKIAKEAGVQVSSVYPMIWRFRQQGIDIPTLQEVRSERFRTAREKRELEEERYGEMQPGTVEAPVIEEAAKEEIAEPVAREIKPEEEIRVKKEVKLRPRVKIGEVEVGESMAKVYHAFNQLLKSGQVPSTKNIAKLAGVPELTASTAIQNLRKRDLISIKNLKNYNLQLTGRRFQPISAKGKYLPDIIIPQHMAKVHDAYDYLKTIGEPISVPKIAEMTSLTRRNVEQYLYKLRKRGLDVSIRVGRKKVEKTVMSEAEKRIQQAVNDLINSGRGISAEKIAAITGDKTKNVYYCIKRLRAKGLIPATNLRRYNLELTGRHLQPLSAKGKDLPEIVISAKAGNVLDAYDYLKTTGEQPSIRKISEMTGMDSKIVNSFLYTLKRGGVGITTWESIKLPSMKKRGRPRKTVA
jgi:biotin operon repressor